MKTLYLECKMGAAGDMLSAALLGLFDETDDILKELNSLGVPKVKYCLEDSKKCGILGKHMSVLVDGVEEEAGVNPDDEDHHNHERSHNHDHDHEHSHEHSHDHNHEHSHDHDHDHEHSHEHSHDHVHENDHEHHTHEHRSLYDIEEIIESLQTCKEIKSDIREVYELLAEAESSVHGIPVSEIHFHEVGNLDAIADITAVCYLMHKLDPDKVIVSPINVGGGKVRAAHGILPVPAPATASLLKGIPSYQSDIESELCTPTGAALVKYFAFEFSNQPVMSMEKIGYGMGKKDFPQANCLRAVLGTTKEDMEQIVELSCNVDDMTPEEIGFASEMLFAGGAVEVYTTSIGMKKGRPGTIITCMCRLDEREKILGLIFKHTTTIGVRENIYNRYVLSREIKKIDTPYGEVRVKRSYGRDVDREKLEYDDISGIARLTGKSLMELKKEINEELK